MYKQNDGIWIGKQISEKNRLLVLGESHYGDEGENFVTSDVVSEYLSRKSRNEGTRWTRFFDKISLSFGYSEEIKPFWDKVFFGNYVDELCGVSDQRASEYIQKHRLKYNNELFSFVNDNMISLIVCFSKLAYWHLPSLNGEPLYEAETIGSIGNRKIKVGRCIYDKSVTHPSCDVSLNDQLMVWGIAHPSARGGYNTQIIYEYLKRTDLLRDYIAS